MSQYRNPAARLFGTRSSPKNGTSLQRVFSSSQSAGGPHPPGTRKAGLVQADLAREVQLGGWDAGCTLITKIELCERRWTDYELIVLARVLSVGLDDLTRGIYKEALQMARTDDDLAFRRR